MPVAIAAVAVGAAASAYAASEQADSQKEAQDANIRMMKNTNAMNYEMFQQSRGSKGYAMLPLYMHDEQGNPYESQLGQNAWDTYQQAKDSAGDEFAVNNAARDAWLDTQDKADATARGVYNGDLVSESLANRGDMLKAQLDNQAQVAAVRQQGVAVRKQAALESLQDTLSKIHLIQTQKGFAANSYGDNLLEANQRRITAGTVAADQSGVNELNASERAGLKSQAATDIFNLKQSDQARRLGNLGLAGQMARQRMDLNEMPSDEAMAAEGRRQSLFNFFKMSPQAFTYQPLPLRQPIASKGQIIAQGIGGVANGVGGMAAGSYMNNTAFAQQQQLQQQQFQNNLQLMQAYQSPPPATYGGYQDNGYGYPGGGGVGPVPAQSSQIYL